jgi:uncharacterized membrane protein YeaQ/YmgE (transglycosylase-associated protein family)
MLHILWSIIIGFIIGFVAKHILPGAEHFGFLLTTALGVAGSFLGGFITSLISKPKDGAMFHPAGIIMSIVGALILLFAYIKLAPMMH